MTDSEVLTDAEVLCNVVECARSYGVDLYRVDLNGDAGYHSIGRDIKSGKVAFYLSDAMNFAVMTLCIMEMLLDSHKRTWLDLGEDTAAALADCLAKIVTYYKNEVAA